MANNLLTLRSHKRGGVSFPPNLRAKNRDSAPHFYGLRTARIRFSQLKSLRIKKKGKSRGALSQKLCLAGYTTIVARGGAGLGVHSELGVPVPVPR